MEETEQNKSEPPTPFKLLQARRKGMVARGGDLGFCVALAAFFALASIAGDWARARLTAAAGDAFILASQTDQSSQQFIRVTAMTLGAAVAPITALLSLLFCAVLAFELVQVRGLFFSPLRLDFSKLNPAQGLKRVFSSQTLIEAAKTVLKAAVYAGLAVVAIREALLGLQTAPADGRAVQSMLQESTLRFLAYAVFAAIAFAALDQLLSRHAFLKRMRMSRRELRREMRDREGDPRQKQRRKRMHEEFAKNSESMRRLKTADVLVANPTHAVAALRYDPETMLAPTIVSRGRDAFALRLKKLATIYGVPIVEDRTLARLLARMELDQPVPESAYARVADIYHHIGAITAKRASREP